MENLEVMILFRKENSIVTKKCMVGFLFVRFFFFFLAAPMAHGSFLKKIK